MAPQDVRAKLAALTPEQREQLKRALAARRAESVRTNERPPVRIQRATEAAEYPLSFAQKRLWMQEQLIEGKTAAYNVALALRLKGEFSIAAFETAVRWTIGRHAVLRTRIATGGQEPRQRILDECEVTLERWAADGAGEASFLEKAGRLANRSFDLEREAPLRVGWMETGEHRHGLVIVLHHIACDGSSLPVLIEDLSRGYSAALRGETYEVEPPPMRYVDYAVWHRDWMQTEEGRTAKAYWVERFADLPQPVELPADQPRPTVQDFSGRHLRDRLDRATLDLLVRAGRREGASLFMVLHAVVVAFLQRYTGQEDFTVGTPTEGRIDPSLEGVVGFFVNTMPLRTRVSPHESFSGLLRRVKDAVLEGFDHQGCPFDVLVEALPLERDLARPPLFNVMMGLTHADQEDVRLEAVVAEPLRLSEGASKVDLTFHFVESENGVEVDLEYATALFGEARMRRLMTYFKNLASAAATDPERAVGDLPLMEAEELRKLVDGFNPAKARYHRERTLVELFREQAAISPKAEAVRYRGNGYTYEEMDALSDRVAVQITKTLGKLAAEEPVALQVERSERMIAALLGILKAGGCYLPLNPGTPPERIRKILEMSGARLRIVEGEAPLEGWNGSDADLRRWVEAKSPEKPDTTTVHSVMAVGGARSLAYVIFTSGSTGEPKGVQIEQRSVVRLVRGTDFLQLGAGDRVLQTGSLAFDASTFEIWGPLLNGGCCCLPEGKEILDVERFGALIEETRANTCFLTTGLFNQFADQQPEVFAKLRHLLTGGEKVSVGHINRVLAKAPRINLLHVYGPTENTTFSSWYPVLSPAIRDVPIGRAIAHSTLYVVDARGNLLPPDVTGEILCGGEGLARGYLRRPELTADRFVPDGFSGVPGACLYRTGDYGRWSEEGHVEFIGRTDDQVKVRGYRIELGEIELRLRACGTVRQAVVVARPQGGTHELVAYVVAVAGGTEMQLRALLAETLPDYMIPSRFVFLETLPLNASGKVDRRALPEPQMRKDEPETTPTWKTDNERTLAEVWREVLGRTPSEHGEHYFNAGGDSIKAIQMSARLRSRGLKLTLRDVFAHPKFGEMAASLAGLKQEAPQNLEEAGELPLTPIQRWFLERCEPPYDRFNQATLFEAEQRLDPERMQKAIAALVERHGMLRCRLCRDANGDWRQTVQKGKVDFIWKDVMLDDEPETSAQALFDMEADSLHGGVSLAEGRLLAAGLFHRKKGDRLLIVVHHWAVDGLSWRVLHEELEALYRSIANEKTTPPNPAGSVPFRAWAQAMQTYGRSPEAKAQLGYWTDVLRRAPRWAGDERMLDCEVYAMEIDPVRTEAFLRRANVAYGTQPADLLLAAFGRAWADAGGEETLLLAMEGHGRESTVAALDVSRTVGWFTSLWPFVLEAKGEWDDRVRQVKDSLRTVPERGVGYSALRYCGDEETRTTLSGFPAPRVSFNYLGEFGAPKKTLLTGVAGGATGRGIAAHLEGLFDIDVVAEVSAGNLRLTVQFHRAVFSGEGRKRLATAFEQALCDCIEHCCDAKPKRSLCDITGGIADLGELDRWMEQAEREGREIEDIQPLTPMQEGMVFHALYEPLGAAYSDQVVLRVRGELDVAIFERAWRALGGQHPNLRAAFRTAESGKAVAVVMKDSYPGFVFAGCLDPTRLQAVRSDARRGAFDLKNGPLLKMTLVRIDPCLHEAILGFHHSILDGWSSGLLWRQLENNYRALKAGETVPPPEATFTDYLRWLARKEKTAELEAWKRVFQGAPAGTAVPTALPRLGAPGIRTRSYNWEFGKERSERLAALARALAVTESSVFQTLWGIFLGRLTQRTDVVFGATVSGRDGTLPGVEAMIGLLINTVPVRVCWEERTTFGELAEQTHRQLVEALGRTATGLAELQAAVLERGELVRHTLVIENYPEDGENSDRLWEIATEAIHDPMHFEFGMLVAPRPEGWLCRVIADPLLHPDAHLEALKEQWLRIADACLGVWQQPIQAVTNGVANPSRRVAVAATFTADPIGEPLEFWQHALGGNPDVVFAPYNQVLQQLIDTGGELHANRQGTNLLLVRLQDWAGGPDADSDSAEQSLELAGDSLVDGLRRLGAENPATMHFVLFCPTAPALQTRPNILRCIERYETKLRRRIEGIGRRNITAIGTTEFAERYTISEVHSPGADALGAVPYTEEMFAALATEIVKRREAALRAPLKVLLLDADNTLWGGVLGEDGSAGLVLAEGHRALQLHAKKLRERGWLLALVTKNNRQDIEDVFQLRSDFPLRFGDFAAIEASWRPKSESIRELGARFGLGLDSFVFLDDSAMECAEVRRALPTVLTIQIPDDPAMTERLVRGLWFGDEERTTEEDIRRSELYRAEARREQLVPRTTGLREFIAQLAIEVAFHPVTREKLPRAAQLTQRTNQFNATTRRRTEDEIEAFLAEKANGGFLVEVNDRFGAYGLTGLVLYRAGNCSWNVDTFLLSCRVLGRGVEHAVLRHLAADAARNGATKLRVPFVKTAKNVPMERFLREHADEEAQSDGTVSFSFGCAAAAVVEVSESEPAQAPMQRDTKRLPDATLPAPWWFHEYVARELCTVEGLRDEIEAHRRRQRNRSGTADYEAPCGEVEQRIAAIWAEVLGVERVGRRDHFFALGGHSLSAVMMLARLQRNMGVILPLEAVFDGPLFGEFAAKALAVVPNGAISIPISQVKTAGHYPLSHAQRRLWMMEQMRGGGPSPFHMVAVFRLGGGISLERLEVALRSVIDRHESLRTGLENVEGEPRQVVSNKVSFKLERLTGEVSRTNAEPGVALFVERDFDLAKPPLLRVGWRRESEGVITLCVVLHHIVSDGWSIGVLADELAAFYEDPGWKPEPLPIQYKDFAEWQNRELGGGGMDLHRDYWRSVFADRPPALDMPTDHPRPAVKQTHGSEVTTLLAQGEWTTVKKCAQLMGGSAFMAAVAALQIVLARHARKRRFVVGSPVAGRDRRELENQIGFYVNLVPLLCDVDEGRTFSEHFDLVRTRTASALSHAAYPFDQLVDDLQLPRDMSRTPLFDVLIVFQSNRSAELRLGTSEIENVHLGSNTSQYDLTFEFAETCEGLRLRIEYDTTLFEKGRIERLASHIVMCLLGAFSAPNRRVGAIPLLCSAEEALLRGFECGDRFGRKCELAIHELFLARAVETPMTPAVAGGAEILSYGELDRRSATMAAVIRDAGVSRGGVVAVAGERTEEYIVAMLGVLRAGCVHMPLELKHPDARLRMIVDDSGARHGIALGTEAMKRLGGFGLELIDGTKRNDSESVSLPKVDPEEIAYVIYTSGTTGRPKGVEVTHRAFSTMIEAQIEAFGVSRGDRCGWWASCAFDATMSEIFLGLVSGGTVVVATEAEREDPDRYRAWLRECGVTVATLPPAFLRVMRRATLRPLRVLITAGEPADPADALHYSKELRYINAYGPTETAVCAAAHHVEPARDDDADRFPPSAGMERIPIGRPLATAAAYILDDAGQRVPIGVPGELCVGGHIVGKGYRGAAEMTAARFVTDQLCGESGMRMYRTGDLARWREDGRIEFLGREDDQVKIRGFRVELSEVEAVIRQQPGVRDAAVILIEARVGPVLVAYVAAPSDIVGLLRENVAVRLPDYMRPGAYVVLERLPTSPNGKLNKAALPEPHFGENEITEEALPATEKERALAQTWAEVLGIGAVGADTDFFAAGGDSIKGLMLISKLRIRGWELSLKTIYAKPKLRAQAEHLENIERRQRRVPEGVVALLPIQKWFFERHADSPLCHFNQAVYYETTERVDVARLRAAVAALWRRHAALRAVFSKEGDGWVQTIMPRTVPAPVPVLLDLCGFVTKVADEKEERWVRLLQEGFDLKNGPLVAFGLIRRDGCRDRVLCITHHLVSDWVSHRILLEDLSTVYGQPEAAGIDEKVSEHAGSEVDEWIEDMLRRTRTGDGIDANGWGRAVAPCAGRPRFGVPGRYGDVRVWKAKFSVEETKNVAKNIATIAGVTVRDALLAAVATAEAAVRGKTDVTVMLEGHGRDAAAAESLDASRTVGWFTVLYPFVARAVAGDCWQSGVQLIRDDLAKLPDGGSGYAWLRAYGAPGALPEVNTEIGLNYLGTFSEGRGVGLFEFADAMPTHAIAPMFERDHAVELAGWIAGGCLHVIAAHTETEMSEEMFQSWCEAIRAYLKRISAG